MEKTTNSHLLSIQPSFNNIKEYAELVFKRALVNDLKPLQKIKEFEAKLEAINPSLYEMFKNEFDYEINTHQVRHFLKTGNLFSIDNSISTIASVWIITWIDTAIKNVKKLNINIDFDFRKYPFENTKCAVDKLSEIFNHVFNKTEQDAKKALIIKNDIIPFSSLFGRSNQSVKNGFINTIYNLAVLQTFGNLSEDQKMLWHDIIEFYYGKYNIKNEELFSYSLKKEEMPVIRQKKEKILTFRDQDYYYWKYFLSLENNEVFFEALEMIIKDLDVVKTIYFKNNHDIMQRELTITTNKKIEKNAIKI